jgi:hypothetical protein
VTCQDPLGEMADCANGSTSVCGTQTCVGDAFPNPSFAVCAPGCNQLCDCPDPPAGGTATLECGPFDTSGANQCYLDCSGGASCPDEMFCLYNQWCTWRSDDLPCGAMQGSYGGCVVDGAIDDSLCTAPGEACIANSLTAPTWGFCSVLGCADTSCDCPAAPGGTAVATCGPILTNNNRACYLPCTDPSQCPAGMSCQSGLCVHLDTP